MTRAPKCRAAVCQPAISEPIHRELILFTAVEGRRALVSSGEAVTDALRVVSCEAGCVSFVSHLLFPLSTHGMSVLLSPPARPFAFFTSTFCAYFSIAVALILIKLSTPL